jgi:hypothetical protein
MKSSFVVVASHINLGHHWNIIYSNTERLLNLKPKNLEIHALIIEPITNRIQKGRQNDKI